jgi:hypothetical protein
MPSIEVCVPEGVTAGDEFRVEWDGETVLAVCPKGMRAGDIVSLHLDWPVAPPLEDSTARNALPQIEVTVPLGCYPGMEFLVDFEGQTFYVAVPDGCGPGTAVTVEAPLFTAPESPSHAAQPIVDLETDSEEHLPAPPLGDGEFAEPGQEVVIQGLKTKPWLNGERACLLTWDAIKGRWKVSVGGRSEEASSVLAIKPENLRSGRGEWPCDCI